MRRKAGWIAAKDARAVAAALRRERALTGRPGHDIVRHLELVRALRRGKASGQETAWKRTSA